MPPNRVALYGGIRLDCYFFFFLETKILTRKIQKPIEFQEAEEREINRLSISGIYICDYSFPRSMLLLRFGSVAASIIHIIACMGGCLGCDINRKLISSVDEPLKGQKKFNARTVAKPSISEDFWTNSNFDMDNSAFQLRGSISSISTSTLDASSSGNWNLPSEFVNHGLLLWNQTRQLWVGNKKYRAQQLCEPRLSYIGYSWNHVESLLQHRTLKSFNFQLECNL